jgi:CPA1 family monovalent cation:H+ antiporter
MAMPLAEIILAVMGLLAVAMLAAGFCRNFAIPYTVFLIILGLALGWLARSFHNLQFLLNFRLSPELVLYLFLPALIFKSAFNINARRLLKDLGPVLTLAIPALLVSTAIIGTGLWFLLGINLSLALLFGALISATDPVAVIALFRKLGTPERLTTLVEGESLLNDATAIVVFTIILGLTMSDALDWTDAGYAVFEFLRVSIGGILVGTLIGLAASKLLRRLFTGPNAFVIMSLVVAYASFAIAEHSLHVSGVMAVIAVAVTLGALWVSRIPRTNTDVIRDTWVVIAMVSNSLLVLLVGLSVDVTHLLAGTDIILIAVVLILLARAATIYSLVPAAIRYFSLPRISLAERHVMWWGGLKGGLAIAIALSAPPDLPGRGLLLTLTLGVVIFSLLVNAPTIRPLSRVLGMDRLTPDELLEVREGLIHAGRKSSEILNLFYRNNLISRSTEQHVRKNTEDLFASDTPDIAGEQAVRRLRSTALKTEFGELKRLYDIGLIQRYTYLDMRNNLRRYRDLIAKGQAVENPFRLTAGESPFLRLETALLKRLREHDWAAWLLARYQNMRLSQRLQHDTAGVLICSAVLEMLESHSEADPAQREQVERDYRERLRRRKARLEKIAGDFPGFYSSFETNLLTRVALKGAEHHLSEERREGIIGPKAFLRIERIIRTALDAIPPLTEPAPVLTASDLIGSISLLQDLSEQTLDRLAAQAKPVTFLQDDLIIEEGERGDALYIISHGAVQVFMDNQYITELRDGDFFGEMALLGDHVRRATVKAKLPTRLLRLARRDVLRLAESEPELKNRLAEEGRKRRQEDSRRGLYLS